MADDIDSLLEQAKAIQAQKLGGNPAPQDPETADLLKQAQAIQQSKIAPKPTVSTPEPGILGKSLDFVKNLPESAIDLVPGMKAKRENVAAYRATPEYQNQTVNAKENPSWYSPTGLPAQTQGQRDESVKKYAQQEMDDPGMMFLGAMGPDSALDIAKSLPLVGDRVSAFTAKFAPKLEAGASKLAESAVKLNPRANIPVKFDEEAGRLLKDYKGTKGVGLSSLNEGAMPMTSGMEGVADANQQAIVKNFKDLDPVITSTQEKINQNPQKSIDEIGNIGDKLAQYHQDFVENLPELDNRAAINAKLQSQMDRMQRITDADGNLPALIAEKKKIYQDTVAASKNAYSAVDKGEAESEATFLQGMGDIVKRHIEDLAGTVDPNAAQQIKGINQNISNLIKVQAGAEKQIGKGGGNVLSKTLSAPTKVITGFTPGQLGQIGGARILNQAAKIVSTPAGSLAQKALPATKTVVENPWTNSLEHSIQQNQIKGQNSTTQAANLYNATDDSLTQVASKLQSQPGLGFLAQSLKEAIDNKDVGAKNRSIFLILQNPSSRKLVSPEQK